MDRETNLQFPAGSQQEPASTKISLTRSTNPDSTSSRSFTNTSSSSSSSSPPALLRHVQAAFKRHRPLGAMQSNNIMPRRLLPQREASKSSVFNVGAAVGSKQNQYYPSVKTKCTPLDGEAQEDSSITLPSLPGTVTNAQVESFKSINFHSCQPTSVLGNKGNDTVSSLVEAEHAQFVEGQKKVQFSMENNVRSEETEWDGSNQLEASTAINHDMEHHNFQSVDLDFNLKAECGISSLSSKSNAGFLGQLHLQSDFSQPMTQSSVIGSSCATTTSVLSSAPMLTSVTHSSHPQQGGKSHAVTKSLGDVDVNTQSMMQLDKFQQTFPSKDVSRSLRYQMATAGQVYVSDMGVQTEAKEYGQYECQRSAISHKCDISNAVPLRDEKSTKGNNRVDDIIDVQSQAPSSKDYSSSDAVSLRSKSERNEKATSVRGTAVPRKRNYDPDMFFKVNGKLYQRLGKIGSGGSSEVHKVISSDCAIYALKKIKLKGRDYATAYGFCQEIEYLNKLKGKDNIIQLIDYEVTDDKLLQEVMNGSMSNKDGRIKDDGFIYMVLEYGEIDLAHMLSQKWKQLDRSNLTIDENWLRFYWQQILLAVNTIHEERIVHSDLKPANFLLVRGSLKLIDFGIAKAILSDTTNIQRDSQVGTLSYMSPEAFLCNETDANGNTIKCGRPSDIWSLGCILYQMVYGRTPFSEYKTFWAKFKVITDQNHEITYETVSNPWLVDIMKKCLAWDRNERWRIPQLLHHPFLAPRIPSSLPSTPDLNHKLLQFISEHCTNDSKALLLCRQLQQMLGNANSTYASKESMSLDQVQKLLLETSNVCIQLQQQIANVKRG